MTASLLRPALVLGLLTAIGPFAIDMYLPALPTIGRQLGTGMAQAQASLTAFFASFALAQMVFGPASDRWGRKRPLMIGLALFIVGSVGSALSPDIGTLVVFRFLQGVGAAAPGVIPRAIVRDLYTGREAARLSSMLMLVFSVSPVLAPLVGSQFTEHWGWRSVFWAVAGIAVVALWVCATQQPETRTLAARADTTLRSTLAACAELLRDRHFLGLTFLGAMGMSAFFAYLASSSFVLMGHYGLSGSQYSVLFSLNAVAFIGVAQLTGPLTARLGLAGLVQAACVGFATAMVALALLSLAGVDGLPWMVGLLFVGFGFLGLVVPSTAVLGMEEHGPIAGTAAALMGTLQMLVGAAVMPLAGLFADGTARPMLLTIAACALATLALSVGTLGWRRRPAAPA
ncbi:multidrug effflux MFS transporter [Aquabacterium sp. J223]|uniref:multidrug effflux MFS transporter n=1 Tax=Aquabacterium sp. J223 TaxID=2898431 RepID=UPI0021AE22AB|nr:multidrug effflux MFS transporter [Aquabacterium sp. J223]UUX94437.1 multidrug effflux MFS transporter [Aquabacterium sp. J223]